MKVSEYDLASCISFTGRGGPRTCLQHQFHFTICELSTTISSLTIRIIIVHVGYFTGDTCVSPPTAPSAPLNVAAFNTSSTSVRVAWDRPETPNGIIINYVISYYPTDVGASSSMNTSTGNNNEVTDLTELDIYTSYTITVTAVTVTQGGPSTSLSVFTNEDGK